MVLQAVYPGRETLEEMPRWSPAAITAWQFRHVLNATYWSILLLIEWLADDVIKVLPAPADGIPSSTSLAMASIRPNAGYGFRS